MRVHQQQCTSRLIFHWNLLDVQDPLPSIDVPVRDLSDFEWENPRMPPPPLEFDNALEAFATHSSLSMMRSLAVFSLCSVQVGFVGVRVSYPRVSLPTLNWLALWSSWTIGSVDWALLSCRV